MAVGAWGAPKSPRARGIESPGYQWNGRKGEKVAALAKQGDPKRGEESFAICTGCHLPDGGGTADGVYPRLAGQHPTVLIKQLADIRLGLRDNPFMYRFAVTLTDPQELADVAAYVAALPTPAENGRGRGTELELGQRLYQRDCASCHGLAGEGNAAAFFPRLAGQHYKYLLRQVTLTRMGQRRNANPAMLLALKPYTAKELEAVCDYISRLSVPAPPALKVR